MNEEAPVRRRYSTPKVFFYLLVSFSLGMCTAEFAHFMVDPHWGGEAAEGTHADVENDGTSPESKPTDQLTLDVSRGNE